MHRITRLHLLYWASGYTAYDKLSPEFQRIIEGLQGLYRSAHKYADPNDPSAFLKPTITAHPLVRVNPVTGWNSLFANRRYTIGIKGMSCTDSQVILQHIFNVFEKSLDAQVRFVRFAGRREPRPYGTTGSSQAIHAAVYDDGDDQDEPRHGIRVSSLAEKPYFDPAGSSRREALGLPLGHVGELAPLSWT